MNGRLSQNSPILVGKVTRDEVVFRCQSYSRVRVRRKSSEFLRNVFENLPILSDPYEKSWHSQDKNATSIN